jgi:hypothetical protein
MHALENNMTLEGSGWVLQGKPDRMEHGLANSVFYIKTNIYRIN